MFNTCEACSVGKSRQKNGNKEWKGGSITPGDRLFIEISSIKGNSFTGAKFSLIVDVSYCWSYLVCVTDKSFLGMDSNIYSQLKKDQCC